MEALSILKVISHFDGDVAIPIQLLTCKMDQMIGEWIECAIRSLELSNYITRKGNDIWIDKDIQSLARVQHGGLLEAVTFVKKLLCRDFMDFVIKPHVVSVLYHARHEKDLPVASLRSALEKRLETPGNTEVPAQIPNMPFDHLTLLGVFTYFDPNCDIPLDIVPYDNMVGLIRTGNAYRIDRQMMRSVRLQFRAHERNMLKRCLDFIKSFLDMEVMQPHIQSVLEYASLYENLDAYVDSIKLTIQRCSHTSIQHCSPPDDPPPRYPNFVLNMYCLKRYSKYSGMAMQILRDLAQREHEMDYFTVLLHGDRDWMANAFTTLEYFNLIEQKGNLFYVREEVRDLVLKMVQ